tara:strand:- start:943 stop:1641 length:699 start_codon:yes stop_codon:yes gene_type:complete
MNIGILGDIHGNHIALESVLRKAKIMNVKKLLITGDLVGYYYNIKEVLDLLDPWDWVSVRGNHEDMLKECIRNNNNFTKIEKKYGSSLRRTADHITEKQLDMLINLPHPKELDIEGSKILLCHGSPWDNNQYIYPDSDFDTLERCAIKNYNIVILGHTHYPMIKLIKSVQIVNPGSVGQSRDKSFGAKWALFNTDTKKISMHSENYDPTDIINSINRNDPHINYLSKILLRK